MSDASQTTPDNATQTKELITQGLLIGGAACIALVAFGYFVAKT